MTVIEEMPPHNVPSTNVSSSRLKVSQFKNFICSQIDKDIIGDMCDFGKRLKHLQAPSGSESSIPMKATSSYNTSYTDVNPRRLCNDKSKDYKASSKNKSVNAELCLLPKELKHLQSQGGSESVIPIKTAYPQSVSSTDIYLRRPYIDKSKNYRASPSDKSLNAELYGIGKRLKHLQPPGGSESGIFDAYWKPLKQIPANKIVKDHFKSHIFQDPFRSPPRPATPLKETTRYRIFQKTPPVDRKSLRNKFESKVFKPDPPPKPLKIAIKRDPITGCNCKITDGEMRLKKYICRNPLTFEGITEKNKSLRCVQPPGGSSSLVLEYDETPRPF